jgi:transcriptional regulator with XRE-family HTH domain
MYEIFEQLLQKRGMSSYEVSKLSGVSQATLSDWKNGKSTPRNKTLKKIADILGVSVAYLLGEEKEKTPDTEASRDIENAKFNELLATLPAEEQQKVYDYLQFVADKYKHR